VIKKTALAGFSRPRQSGVNAITINEGDQLLEARLTTGTCQIMMAVEGGRAIRFPETKVRPTGRGAIGVGGIEVDSEKDEVVGMICVDPTTPERTVLVISEKGYGKRTTVEDYRITNRGGKGVKTINVTDKTGKLVGILDVAESEDIIITCKSGVTIRMKVSQISEQGRATQGVKLIKLDEGDEIAAITKITIEDETGEIAEVLESEGITNLEQDDTTNIDPTSSVEENEV
jgi:DNA gyrase subunit A